MGYTTETHYYCSICGLRNGYYPKDGSPNKLGRKVLFIKRRAFCPIHRRMLRSTPRTKVGRVSRLVKLGYAEGVMNGSA